MSKEWWDNGLPVYWHHNLPVQIVAAYSTHIVIRSVTTGETISTSKSQLQASALPLEVNFELSEILQGMKEFLIQVGDEDPLARQYDTGQILARMDKLIATLTTYKAPKWETIGGDINDNLALTNILANKASRDELAFYADANSLSTHINSQNNPHDTTATQVGAEPLGAVAVHETTTNHPAATTNVKGMMSASDKFKLDGIELLATANSTDASLRDRSTHTGTQSYTTITGLGNAATKNVGTVVDTVVAGNDSRLSDSRIPTGIAGGDLTGNYPSPTLTTTGITTGTYKSVTVDSKGRIISGTNPTTLSGYGITDAINNSEKGVVNGVATLDASGLIPSAQLPPLAITDTFPVVSEAEMLALTAQVGDIAIRTDLHKSFILRIAPSTTLVNWQELETPTDTVLSVNGQVGTVNLTATNVGAEQSGAIATHETTTNHPLVTTTVQGMMSSNDKLKLDGIQSGATANSTDAQLRDRSTHTGTQSYTTITGLGTAATQDSSSFATANHNHNASAINSGTLEISRLPVSLSGESNTTTVVRADDSRLSNARTPIGTAGGDLTGTYPNPTLINTGTAGTYTKITTDAKGRIINGTSLAATDVPDLDISKITTGTLPIDRGGTGGADAATARSNLGITAPSKNALINGDFRIAQRGTSFDLAAIGATYTLDRWLKNTVPDGGTPATGAISQQDFPLGQLSVPGEPENYCRINNTNQGTNLGVNSNLTLNQHIENVRSFAGQTITLSFYARSTIANKRIGIEFIQSFGSGGSLSSQVVVNSSLLTLSSGWVRYTFVVAVPSIAGKIIGSNNNSSLRLLFWLQAGSGIDSRFNTTGGIPWGGTGSTDISNVQVELGNVSTEFEQRHIQQELALCQRYYEKSYELNVAPGTVTANGNILGLHIIHSGTNRAIAPFKVPKRITPTLTFYNPVTANSNTWRDINANVDRIVSGSSFNGTNLAHVVVNESNVPVGNYCAIHWAAEAEY